MENLGEKSITEQVLRNSLWVFLTGFLTKIGGLIFTILLARYLLPEKFGEYSIVLSVAILFMVFGDLGINQTLMTFFSKHLKNKNKANTYFNFLFFAKLVFISGTSVALLISSYFLAKYVFAISNLTPLFIASAFYMFFFSLSGFFASFFYIYKKVKLDFFKEFLFQITRMISVLILFFFFSSENYLAGIFFSLVLASLGMLVFSLFFSKKLFPLMFTKSKEKINKKRVSKFLFYLAIGGISLLVFSEVDIFMLGILIKDLAYIGYYRAIFALILGVTGLIGITSILLPILSSFKIKRAEQAFDKVIKYTFLFSIPACFGVLVFGKYFIRLFYGSEYLAGALILYFLTFLIFSETTTGLFSTLFTSQEKPKYVTKSIIVSLGANLVLNYFLITIFLKTSILWATAGAAIATLFSRYLFMFMLIFYSKKKLGVEIKKEHIIKPLIASLIMAGIVYLLLPKIDVTFFSGIMLVLCGVLIYFSTMLFIKGIKKQDLEIFSFFWKKEN